MKNPRSGASMSGLTGPGDATGRSMFTVANACTRVDQNKKLTADASFNLQKMGGMIPADGKGLTNGRNSYLKEKRGIFIPGQWGWPFF
jgi:hypothetical protein